MEYVSWALPLVRVLAIVGGGLDRRTVALDQRSAGGVGRPETDPVRVREHGRG